MANKINQVFLILIFLLSLILPILFADFPGGKYSGSENRNLGTFPQIFTESFRLASGIKTYGEKWLDDNIGFRIPIKKVQNKLEFKIFHVSPSNKVIIGEKGWFYYTRDNNLEIGLGTYTISDDRLQMIAKKQESIQKSLTDKGIEYIIVLIPSKVSVYPEYIGGGFAGYDTIIDMVSAYLLMNTSIPVINLKPDLIKAKNNEAVFFKQDTHFNDMGLYFGYQAIYEELVNLKIIESPPAAISIEKSVHKGDLTSLMGLANTLPPEPYNAISLESPKAKNIESIDNYGCFSEIVKKHYKSAQCEYYQNEHLYNRKVLFLGDSCLKLQMVSLFAENFSETYFIRSHDVNEEFIQDLMPNVVILEITERLFDNLWEN